MTLKIRICLAKSFKIRLLKVAALREYRIECGSGVTLRENESVPCIPLGILGIDIELFKVEISNDIRNG
jgi:hypothetical protein